MIKNLNKSFLLQSYQQILKLRKQDIKFYVYITMAYKKAIAQLIKSSQQNFWGK